MTDKPKRGRGRPTHEEAHAGTDFLTQYRIDHQSDYWIDRNGNPIKNPVGQPAGWLTLPPITDEMVLAEKTHGMSKEDRANTEQALKKGWKIALEWVVGDAEYFIESAAEKGTPITRKAGFQRAIREILDEFGLNPLHVDKLAARAIRRDQLRRRSGGNG